MAHSDTHASFDSLLSQQLIRGREPKKTVVVLVRWVLIVACSCLILFSDAEGRGGTLAHLMILFFIFSNLVLATLPGKVFTSHYFDHCLVTFDIIFVTACIWFSGQMYSELYLLYFLIIMIAALGQTLRAIIWSAVLVALVYVAVMFSIGGSSHITDPEILVRIPFFFVVALFYGHFAQVIRSERSEKVEYQKKLGVTKCVREISGLLIRSLDRNTILNTLTKNVSEFCQAEYCAVISRGSKRILVETGNSSISSPKKRCSMLLTDLGRRMETGSSDLFSSRREEIPAVEGGTTQRSQEDLRICFCNDRFSFLPVNGQVESDLYLCLMGSFDSEVLEYVGLLLISASMALNNAGQYQELVHEVEKRQEVVRRLSSVLKFKSEFVANISHEIRTPIHSFIGFAELLLGGGYGELTADQQKILGRMLDNAKGLLELINNILDNARLDAGECKVRCTHGDMKVFIEEIVDTCIALVKDKPVSMQVTCDTEIPTVITDWGVLRQIAINLVSNAVKFTPKGRVEVAAGFDQERRRLTIRVTDTGIGVSAEKIQQIFEPFRQLENSYTKKYAGTGLGLAITKKQVELLGGEIKVRSKPNYGSEFSVHLPVEVKAEERGHPKVIATILKREPVSAVAH